MRNKSTTSVSNKCTFVEICEVERGGLEGILEHFAWSAPRRADALVVVGAKDCWNAASQVASETLAAGIHRLLAQMPVPVLAVVKGNARTGISESICLEVDIVLGVVPGALFGPSSPQAMTGDTASIGSVLEQLLERISQRPIAAAATARGLRAMKHLCPEEAVHLETLTYSLLQAGDEYRSWFAQYSAGRGSSPTG